MQNLVQRIEFDDKAAVFGKKELRQLPRHQRAVSEDFHSHIQRTDETDHLLQIRIKQRLAAENYDLARPQFRRLRQCRADFIFCEFIGVVVIARRITVGTTIVASARRLNLH